MQSEIKQNVAKLEENSFLQRSKVVDFIDFFIFLLRYRLDVVLVFACGWMLSIFTLCFDSFRTHFRFFVEFS